jgi:hypothetical protein
VITVGALDNYVVLFDKFRLASHCNGFTLPGQIRLCASPHKAFDGRVGRQFRGRRGPGCVDVFGLREPDAPDLLALTFE